MGISTASATSCAMEFSNSPITDAAATAVRMLVASQGTRRRAVCITLSVRLDSSPTPARRRMSSSCSSSRTAMASSMVMMPTSRSSRSTTGAEIR